MRDGFYLQYNKFEDLLDVFSFFLRIFLCGPNHAIEVRDGVVCEYVGSNWRWYLKHLRHKYLAGPAPVYAANSGCGYKETPVEVWARAKSRHLEHYTPNVPLREVPVTGGYGYLKLFQMGLNIMRKKWFVTGNTWNGRDGLGRLLTDKVCSEYLALRLGLRRWWLVTPADLKAVRELDFQYECKTVKGVGFVVELQPA